MGFSGPLCARTPFGSKDRWERGEGFELSRQAGGLNSTMIAHLRGKLIYKQPGQAIVEAGGVGYDVTISVPTFTALPLWVRRPRSSFIRRSAKIRLRCSDFSIAKRSGSSSG